MTLTLLLAGSNGDAYGVQNADSRMPAGLQASAASAA